MNHNSALLAFILLGSVVLTGEIFNKNICDKLYIEKALKLKNKLVVKLLLLLYVLYIIF